MTISFSGLASGLDTSSWVKSLTALKQAKITELEEQKEHVLLSVETLNSIRSFFTSFRSVLERVTDSKFGISSMDLFAQNLANSTNLNVLTATATTEAEESEYAIDVKNLATNTQVNSKHTYTTTDILTETATLDSKLNHLGVKSGRIGVTVEGVEHNLRIEEGETIRSFIEKLASIGVESNYNDKSGVFTVNLNTGDINDIDNTGIIDALQLEGVNEGYTSNSLQTSKTDTVYHAAQKSTKLSELGVSSGVVTINANDKDYNVTINTTTTLGNLITTLNGYNIKTTLTEDGVFTIEDAVIKNEGTTGIVNALGLSTPEVYSKTQTSKQLSHGTTVIETTTATRNTQLKDIGDGITVNNNSTVILKDANNKEVTLTVSSTSTIGDLLDKISAAGLYTNITEEGVIEISGGTVTGGTFDMLTAFGLNKEPLNSYATGNELTEVKTVNYAVTLNTKLVDDMGVTEGYMKIETPDGTTFYEKIYSGQIIGDLITDLGNLGISAHLDEETGIMEITGGAFYTMSDTDVLYCVNTERSITEPDSRYHHGTNLLTCLTGAATFSANQTSVATSRAQTKALSYSVTRTYNATKTSTLSSISLTTSGTAVFDVRGTSTTINVLGSDTIETLITKLSNAGIAASFDEDTSRLMIENAYITGGSSNLSTVLNLEKIVSGKYVTSTSVYVTTTVAATMSSTAALTYITDTAAQIGDKISSFTNANGTITVYNSVGTSVGTVAVDSDTTFESLFRALDDLGIQGTMENGVVTLTSNNGNYVTGDPMTALGITTTTTTTVVTTTVGTTQSSSVMTYVEDQTAKIGDKISTFTNANGTVTVYNPAGTSVGTVAVDSNTTFESLFRALDDLGIQGTMENGVVTLTSNVGNYVTGDPLTALGITTTTTTTVVTTTVGTTQSSSVMTYVEDQTAKIGDKISSFTNANGTVTVYNPAGTSIGTVAVDSDTTFESLFRALDDLGIQGTMENGVVTLTSNVGNYVTGDPMTALGIGTANTVYTSTLGIDSTSSDAVTYSTTTYTTTYPTTTRTVQTTATVVVTQPIIGTQTITVSDTVTTTEAVIGTKTITITNTFTETIAEIGSQTITVSDTVTVPVATIGSQTLLITHTHVCTEPVIGSEVIEITSTIVRTETLTGPQTISTTFNTNVVAVTSATVTVGTSVTITIEGSSTTTVPVFATLDTKLGDLGITDFGLTLTHYDSAGNVDMNSDIEDINSNTTIGELLAAIKSESGNKLVGSINNGVISFAADNSNWVISGKLATALGIGITTTNTTTYSSTTKPLADRQTPVIDGTIQSNGMISGGKNVAITSAADLQAMNGKTYNGYNFYITGSFKVSDLYNIKLENCVVDGCDNMIELAINAPTYGIFNGGLFSDVRYSTIKNLKTSGSMYLSCENADSSYVGGIAGNMDRCVLQDVSTQALVQAYIGNRGTVYVGAFVGMTEWSNFYRVASGGVTRVCGQSYTEELSYAGGVAGYAAGSTFGDIAVYVKEVEHSYNSTSYSGGVVGWGTEDMFYNICIGNGLLMDGQTGLLCGYTEGQEGWGTYMNWGSIYHNQHEGYLFGNLRSYVESPSSNLGSSWILAGNGAALIQKPSTYKAAGTYYLGICNPNNYSVIVYITVKTNATVQQIAEAINAQGFDAKVQATGNYTNLMIKDHVLIDPLLSKVGSIGKDASGYYNHIISNAIINYTKTNTNSNTLEYNSVTTSTTSSMQTISSTGITTITMTVTTPVTYSFSTVVQAVTGTRSVTDLVVATVTVEKTGTTVVTHQTVTATVVEKTTTAPVTYTVTDSFVVDTVKYKTVTHTLSNTITVEDTTTKEVTHTVLMTLTVENTTTQPVTLTVVGTGTIETTTVSVTPTTTNVSMRGDTKFSQLGISSDQTVSVVSSGVAYTVTVNSNDTVDDMLTSLSGLGIYANISEDGMLTLIGDKDAYITGMSSDLASALKLTLGSGSSYTTQNINSYSNTLSNQQHHNVTLNATGETTIDQISKAGTIVVNYEGTTYSVTVNGTKTIGDVLSELAGYGISGSIENGVVKLTGTGTGYVTDAGSAFGITGSAYTTSTTTSISGINSLSNQQHHNVTLNANGETTIDQISKAGTIVVNYEGTTYSVTVNGTKTIGDVLSELAGYGISGSIENGVVKLTGTGNGYVTDAGSAFGITGSAYTTSTTTTVSGINSLSNQQHHNVTLNANGETTIDQISKAGTIVVNYEGTTYSVTVNGTKTIGDVLSELAGYGISGSIENGVVKLTGTGNGYVTDAGSAFGITGSAYTTSTTTTVSGINSLSNQQHHNVTHNVNDNVTLAQLGMSASGYITVVQNGTQQIVTLQTNSTMSEIKDMLAAVGIKTDYSAGKVVLSGTTDSFILGLDDNAKSVFKFSSNGGVNNSYSYTYNAINGNTTQKLSQLTDSSGTNLGITSGNIYVYKDGTRSLVSIDNNDTLETLSAKLSPYGITMGIASNGKMYFDGTNNSYMTTSGITSGASNILSKFNIEGNWSTLYDSKSKNLTYTRTGDETVQGSTRLNQLKDSTGSNLGITTGQYYVYSDGVRNTETITGDMTVNDLMGTMAKYGLIADINEDGSISVGGYGATYLETSALAGSNSSLVRALFNDTWDFTNVYTSNHLSYPVDEIGAITATTKLADIREGSYRAGYITVVKDGISRNITLTSDDTVGTLINELALYGFETAINDKGQLLLKNTGDSLLMAPSGDTNASNILGILGIELNSWVSTNTYESKNPISVTTRATLSVAATETTKLSDLGVTTGEYYIYKNGVKNTVYISSNNTLGDFINTLKSFGIESKLIVGTNSSVLETTGLGDTYISKSNNTNAALASNIVDKIFDSSKTVVKNTYSGLEQTSELVTTHTAATEETLLSYYDSGSNKAKGNLYVTVNGVENTVKITEDETIGSLLNKFRALGLEATLSNGQIMIQSGYDTLNISEGVNAGDSKLKRTVNLVYNADLGGYSATGAGKQVEQTTTVVETRTVSVANNANDSTTLSLLNISSGSLTVYRNGEKATIDVDKDQTFGDLRRLISARFNDVDLTFENGYLTIASKNPANKVEVGATTDTSNFSAITGITTDETGKAKSARALYCVNNSSVLTTTKLFVKGDVTEGDFFIGDERIEINDRTTMADVVARINSSEKSNATAYWDNIDGKLVIKSRTTGASLINIEAGSSNFTEIMGLTSTRDGVSRMNTEVQQVGQNAKFTINGTYFTASSNNIGSDISRIKGVTINLKGISEEGSSVVLKVEKDKETVATAVSDIVDAYNELIENVDKEIQKGGQLSDQSTLKFIRNQIRSLMTSSITGSGVFKNLDSIGISLNAATAGNIRTDNINVLAFNKEKFLQAFEADRESLKNLIVGTETNMGIFQRVETVVESAVTSATGYFASAEKSYTNKVSKLDDKIKKAQRALEKYKERLEAKFSAMDLLISNMQNQYSSFLG